jgi:hypothetical protein
VKFRPRKEALAAGKERYSTGRPCCNGHIAERYTKSCECVECAKNKYIYHYYHKNIEVQREKRREQNRRVRGCPEPTRPCPEACEICDTVFAQNGVGRKRLYLDHCHATGVFRGWICYACNTSLGHFGDNEAGIQKVFDYLKRSQNEFLEKELG